MKRNERQPKYEEIERVVQRDAENERLKAECARLKAEMAEEAAGSAVLRDRMADLLTRTANALKGDPGPLKLHDWSDLPEVAANARENADLHTRYLDRMEAILGPIRQRRSTGEPARSDFEEVAKLKAEVERLRGLWRQAFAGRCCSPVREALEYASHKGDCDMLRPATTAEPSRHCTCGFDAWLARTSKGEAQEPEGGDRG